MKRLVKHLVISLCTLFLMVSAAYATHCSRCNYDNPYGASTCVQCGAPLVVAQEVVYCQNCGLANPYSSYYCSRCGAPLHAAPPAPASASYVDFEVHSHKHHHESHSEWRYVATISANGNEKPAELPGAGSITHFKLRGASGSIIIDTFVIREGGNAEHFPITTRFSPGQEVTKDLSRAYNSTGFRVSRRGTGSVELYVQ